jgi:hypothetical protein
VREHRVAVGRIVEDGFSSSRPGSRAWRQGGRALTNELLELGLLGVLTLALAVAVYLVRRSGQADDDREIESPAV